MTIPSCSLERDARIMTLLRKLAGATVPDHALCVVAKTVSHSSAQFGYDPLLLLAVIRVESVFNAGARGRFLSGTPERRVRPNAAEIRDCVGNRTPA